MPIEVVVAAGVFGLVFGSFVTALSYRLPRGISIAQGRSRCSACGHTLGPSDLVPVVSWVAHRGGCAHCGARIPVRYPLIEIACAASFMSAAALQPEPKRLAVLCATAVIGLALAVIDLEQRRLPDSLVVALAPLMLTWRWLQDGGVVAGLVAGLVVLIGGASLNHLARGRGGAGIGGGDIKLLAVAALALALPQYFAFVAAAGILGLIFGSMWKRWRGEARFPFGPAVILALFGVLIAPVTWP